MEAGSDKRSFGSADRVISILIALSVVMGVILWIFVADRINGDNRYKMHNHLVFITSFIRIS